MKGGKSIAHAIIRGANGRRHEVVFDGAAITVEIFSGEDVVEIVAEANDPLLPSDKRRFSIGDKVMQVENDYDKEVYNGDLGVVRSIDAEASGMVIEFDGRPVTYGFGELDEIALAYATTIHKSQGSEYPAVVIPLTTQHNPMLQRNLVYTAVTRGKRLVVIVGQKKAMAIAMKGRQVDRRWSKLKEWLRPSGWSRPT